ncbi:MAG: ribosomal L7Ae/L30e/S12e/Gadd45 family protein [Fusicatenibacter sp.]|nr:ribosomal L7Ae/L30e/S12e/Gadd45 family protein [Fusicatenibacter sp.]
MLSLAMKAGKVVSGEFQTEQAIKGGSAALVIIAEEASANTQKKFRNMCAYYKVPHLVYGTKEQLGRTIGREERSSVAVCDRNFAEKIAAMLTEPCGMERSVDQCKGKKSEKCK